MNSDRLRPDAGNARSEMRSRGVIFDEVFAWQNFIRVPIIGYLMLRTDYRVALACFIGVLLCCFANINLSAQSTDVLTFHNDSARTGQTLHEEILTPANVNSTNFGKLRTLPVDGKIDAQPLYVAGVNIPGKGMRNVLYVATEAGSLYAYDADSSTNFWRVSPFPAGEFPSDNRNCPPQISPNICITATPVIDRGAGPNGTLYVVMMTKNISNQYFQRLHALDLATGADRLPAASINASYPGTGDNSIGGMVSFDPGQYVERSGLLLLNGVIYTAWSSHCDIRPYTSWIIGYDQQTLQQTSVLNLTPNGQQGAIWMSGGGLAADAAGNIFAMLGNGSFDTNLTADGFPSLANYGNAFVKVSNTNGLLAVTDYFSPSNTVYQNANDGDLGSGGVIVLPDVNDDMGNPRQLAVGAGKDENIYVVDRANMGKFNPATDDAAYQKLGGALAGGVFSTPAYFNQTVYYGASGGPLRAFPIRSGRLGAVTSQSAHVFTGPGATPAISANGTNDAIVWALNSNASAFCQILAYDATNLTNQLYFATGFGNGTKFVSPTIASGRVYVPTAQPNITVFGLLNQSTLTPIQVWRDNNFRNPSNVGAGANGASPAGDGIPNLIKYALGIDPKTSTNLSHYLTPGLYQTNALTYAELKVNRVSKVPDVSYTVEVSSNLVTWSSSSADVALIADDPTQLTVMAAAPLGDTPIFMRLRISIH